MNIPKSVASELTKITLFFDDLKEVQYEDQPNFTWISLLGGIGGYLGLFIGFSLISAIELLEFFFVIITGMHKAENKWKTAGENDQEKDLI